MKSGGSLLVGAYTVYSYIAGCVKLALAARERELEGWFHSIDPFRRKLRDLRICFSLTPGVDLVHNSGTDSLVAGEGRLDGLPLRAHRLVSPLHVVRAVVARRGIHLKANFAFTHHL